ncbi:hypothetical protein SAMD00019534_046100, partial [Acytostelium subglobosum LB1]|uniref:hypothetical protein n=1 Tax=Acytostelium subglobosum LB1 TaxID=1410327 RepID=UPI000644A360
CTNNTTSTSTSTTTTSTTSTISNTQATTNPLSTTTPTSTSPPRSPKSSKPSFYQRPLPPHLVAFSSDDGRKLFRESLQDGHMEGYFALSEQFVSQSEPAFCGLATLAMVLNALKIDPKRLWKGPWRWFAEDMLDCCAPIESVKKRGITFTEFACLSKCNGATVASHRGDEVNLEQFRRDLVEACSKPSQHMVLSYDRKTLGQTGSGHFSPIGGYHQASDKALIMDVARFKYSPHWVPVQVLFDSMQVLDPETQKPRGYFIITSDPTYQPSFCHVKNTLSWASIADAFIKSLPETLHSSHHNNVQDVIIDIFRHLPSETLYVLCAYSHELHNRLNRDDSKITWINFWEEIAKTKTHATLDELIRSGRIDWSVSHQHDSSQQLREVCHENPIGLASILFLSFPAHVFGGLSNELREEIANMRNLDWMKKDIIDEVMRIRQEMFQVRHSPCQCPEDSMQCNVN